MSLNWRELHLICSELPLQESKLQSVVQHDFHSLSWNFYHPQQGRWTLYTEIGTPYARIHKTSGRTAPPQSAKTAKLQRFVQYCRANIEGACISEAEAQEGDRILALSLKKGKETFHIFFRLYSGPGANIIITDSHLIILELLYRRPNRGETNGQPFILPLPKPDDGRFPVRKREEGISFNEQIEREYGEKSTEQTFAQLKARLIAQRERELGKIEGTVRTLLKKKESNKNFEYDKENGDLLASNLHLIHNGSNTIEVDDWYTGGKRTLNLDPKISLQKNIELYYAKYQRAKGTYENAVAEYDQALKEYEKSKEYYANLFTLQGEDIDIRRFKKALGEQTADKPKEKISVGLTIQSGLFTLLVGRNAKENDQLLRHYTRGNDWWMHTRDYPGGYVFIKAKKDKTIPLETMLDAGNLAINFSKAKSSGKADLYFTQVKYLRRAKNGPLGLVLPTHEKNITVQLEQKRLDRLFKGKE